MTRKDNRIRIRPDVYRSLQYYIADKQVVISGVPGIALNKNDVVSEILMNFLAAQGHYPPRDE